MNRRTAIAITTAAAIAVAAAIACSGGGTSPRDLLNLRSGGDGTADTATRNAFSLPARNLDTDDERARFAIGDSFFTSNWVIAGNSTEARDGLGPLFIAQSCSSCHGHDGRARPPLGNDDPVRGLVVQISLPTKLGGTPEPDPAYGGSIQDRAILGIPPEAEIHIRWETIAGEYADGSPYRLVRPVFTIAEPAYGALHPELQIGPRIAPPVFGAGLLEAIPLERLRELADPDDADGDGISGRVNLLPGGEAGRFGWKANQPAVDAQVAGAFHGDIGITSPLRPDPTCTDSQTACLASPDGGDPEISAELFDDVVFYVQTLAVPAARDYPGRERGAELFFAAGCQHCHAPRHRTGRHPVPALSDQLIFPYTDLLLHDMGPGLADGRPHFQASGSEWRTPPLWGIGLTETVNGHTRFLHDGRARNLAEAILWHGGEAEPAREAFRSMSAEDRAALIEFLESL